MIIVRAAEERGQTQTEGVESYHTFCFGSYYDPRYVGFRDLLVLNEHRIQPGCRLPIQASQDAEMLSCVWQGCLLYEDSLGNQATIQADDLIYVSAGTGIAWSKLNTSPTAYTHLWELWLVPPQSGLPPTYAQMTCSQAQRRNCLYLVASGHGRDRSLTIHQDAAVYLTWLDVGNQLVHTVNPGRHAWVQIVQGAARLNNLLLTAGDGGAVREEAELTMVATQTVEILLIDLA